jgi:hypothetical protein
MERRLLTVFILFIISLFSTSLVRAQSVCATSLSDAQDNYDSGHLYGIPAILKPCLDNGFSDNEKVQAYWLLVRTYLIIDDPISAEDSYLKLLRVDPEFEVDEVNDPIEIVHLSEKFKTTPIFTWTILTGGINTTSVRVINTYSTGSNNSSDISYKGSIGFQVASSLELNINDNWSLNGGIQYATRNYLYKNTLFGEDLQALKETQRWIEVPLFVKYSRKYNKFHPYIYGGYSFQYLLSAQLGDDPNGNGQLVNNESSGSGENSSIAELSVTGPSISVYDSRTHFTQSAIAGLGVRYRMGYRYLVLDARYTLGMTNLLNQKNQFTRTGDNYENDLLFRYGYVASDFAINSMSFSIGYVHPLYKPRKIDSRPNFIQRLFHKKGGSTDE